MDDYWTWSDDAVDLSPEQQRWRARDISYYRGPWDRLQKLIPNFEMAPFRINEIGPENQHLRMVIRLPLSQTENPIPIATVSPTYSLASHLDVAEFCIQGLMKCGIERSEIRAELGLTELGEWMNLRLLLPERFSMKEKSGLETALRLECFNSVDGSSRLLIVFGWIRYICSNGLIIGDTMIEMRERHDGSLALEEIPGRIKHAFRASEADKNHRLALQDWMVTSEQLTCWVDGPLSGSWGKKAAARVLHICQTGHDAELADPFAKGEASCKPMKQTQKVAGSPPIASTVFDVMQAMSHVAATRRDATEQLKMLRGLDALMENLKISED